MTFAELLTDLGTKAKQAKASSKKILGAYNMGPWYAFQDACTPDSILALVEYVRKLESSLHEMRTWSVKVGGALKASGLSTQPSDVPTSIRMLVEAVKAAKAHRDAEFEFAKIATGSSFDMLSKFEGFPLVRNAYIEMLRAREALNEVLVDHFDAKEERT